MKKNLVRHLLICCNLMNLLAISGCHSGGLGANNNSTIDKFTEESVILFRHGEKRPGVEGKNGQLSCQGLNRALALPDVLLHKFGNPSEIFAAQPTENYIGDGGYYIRPLQTIEPTAISLDMPVNLQYSTYDSAKLGCDLANKQYAGQTILVSWEHKLTIDIAKNLFVCSGLTYNGPEAWTSDDDYDNIFVVKLTRNPAGKVVNASITKEQENLNNMPLECPN